MKMENNMPKKKQLELPIETKAVEVNPGDKIRQDIANLCTQVGDRSFVIRQANSDITTFYAQIDQLRDQLRTLEQPKA